MPPCRTARWPFAARALQALLLLPTGACSVILEAETVQCTQSEDCAGIGADGATCVEGLCRVGAATASGGGGAGGGAADPKWGCLGKVVWDEEDPTVPVAHSATFRRLFGEAPIVDMKVTACTPLDAECQEPVASGTTDDTGRVDLALFKGFGGFMVPEPPASFPEMSPSVVVVSPPLSGENSLGVPVHLTSIDELGFAAEILEVVPNPELGHIFGLTMDCTQQPAGGISVKVDTVSAETVTYYLNASGLPSKTAGETSVTGNAGFVNVPPGYVTVTATSAEVGKVGTLTVLVRAGFITFVPVGPSP
jgi:hypothetical protein